MVFPQTLQVVFSWGGAGRDGDGDMLVPPPRVPHPSWWDAGTRTSRGALLMFGDLIAAPRPRRGDMGVTMVWGNTRGSPSCSYQAAVLLSLEHTKYPKGA